jgi:hypothetical protein
MDLFALPVVPATLMGAVSGGGGVRAVPVAGPTPTTVAGAGPTVAAAPSTAPVPVHRPSPSPVAAPAVVTAPTPTAAIAATAPVPSPVATAVVPPLAQLTTSVVGSAAPGTGAATAAGHTVQPASVSTEVPPLIPLQSPTASPPSATPPLATTASVALNGTGATLGSLPLFGVKRREIIALPIDFEVDSEPSDGEGSSNGMLPLLSVLLLLLLLLCCCCFCCCCFCCRCCCCDCGAVPVPAARCLRAVCSVCDVCIPLLCLCDTAEHHREGHVDHHLWDQGGGHHAVHCESS